MKRGKKGDEVYHRLMTEGISKDPRLVKPGGSTTKSYWSLMRAGLKKRPPKGGMT